MKSLFARFLTDESGATAIEYALIAGIVGVGIAAILPGVRDEINTTFGNIVTALQTANTPPTP
jgi:pilus assembly protein Flp/PilA